MAIIFASFTDNLNDAEKAILFRDMAIGRYKRNKTQLKILLAIWEFRRHAIKKGFKALFPSKALIAEMAKCSIDRVTHFINSHAFGIYAAKRTKAFVSNEYALKDWVIALFDLIKKKGIVRALKTQFDKGHARLIKFMNRCVIDNVDKGEFLMDVVNNLSTKTKRIPATDSPRIPASICASRDHSLTGIKTNIGDADLGAQETKRVSGILANRLHLGGADIRRFFELTPTGKLRQAALSLAYDVEMGKVKPKSMVKMLQWKINRLRAA